MARNKVKSQDAPEYKSAPKFTDAFKAGESVAINTRLFQSAVCSDAALLTFSRG